MCKLTFEEEYVILVAWELKDAVEKSKRCGFSKETIIKDVAIFYDEYDINKNDMIYPKNAGWINQKK